MYQTNFIQTSVDGVHILFIYSSYSFAIVSIQLKENYFCTGINMTD